MLESMATSRNFALTDIISHVDLTSSYPIPAALFIAAMLIMFAGV